MQFSLLAAASLLAVSVSAYEVLTPALNATVAKGKSVSIEWASVDSDADVFSVYLTNFLSWPPVVLSLAQNVPRDDLSIDLRVPCNLASGYGWQLNFINGTNTYVIYAQSPSFFLAGDCTEPAPTSVPYPTGTNSTALPGTTVASVAAGAATVVQTVATVVYATPIIWFVEPSKAAAGALAAGQTVTVYNNGPVPVTCGGNGALPTPAPAAGGNAGANGAPTTPAPEPTKAGLPQKATFTGAAVALQGSSLIAVAVGAVAFFL